MLLQDEELLEFIEVFTRNNYEIITLQPTAENVPESLIDSYKDVETHRKILADPAATFSFFSIRYQNAMGEEMLIPAGMFGVSESRKVRFPLLINGFWQMILMGNKDSFSHICDQDTDLYYPKFIELKSQFMKNIFSYYQQIDQENYSVMAWPSRGEKSVTRRISELLGYHRAEEGKMELYTSAVAEEAKLNYLSDCVLRWGILIDDRQQTLCNVNYPFEQLQSLVRGMVGYPELVKVM